MTEITPVAAEVPPHHHPHTVHPALVEHGKLRQASLQSRIADRITNFAGSMPFVYIHAVWFIIWISVPVEKYPFGLLTMIVSLEAIFISTFIMISQNQADAKRESLANHQWKIVQVEEQQNEHLIDISQKIHDLTQAMHKVIVERDASAAGAPPVADAPG